MTSALPRLRIPASKGGPVAGAPRAAAAIDMPRHARVRPGIGALLLMAPPHLAIDSRAPLAVRACAEGDGDVEMFDRARADRLIERLREARVGGTFWGARPTIPPGSTLFQTQTGGISAGPAPRLAVGPIDLHRPSSEAMALPTGPLDPWHLLDHADGVVAPQTDPLAILARLLGRPQRERDSTAPKVLTVAERQALAWEVLVQGIVYRCPFDGRCISAEVAIDLLAEWRRHLDTIGGIGVQLGMRRWKRPQIDRFLRTAKGVPAHARTMQQGLRKARATGSALAIWPSRVSPALAQRAADQGVALARIEDGFLRSPGLGVHLVPPLSITLDRQGLHYDPTRPSDLETLLRTHPFPPALLARAARLRAAIVAAGIGKYGRSDAAPPIELPPDRPVMLVIGQVADDRSVQLGDVARLGNAGLIARVRAEAPDALLLYRPHPDVIAGHRDGDVPRAVLGLVDCVLDRPCALAPLLARADAVHVLTSLTGFEALLRGRPVVCHGAPFYAGWGLTSDRVPLPRRGRPVPIDALVAASLLLYPLYLDPETGLPCAAERVVAHLAAAPPARSPLVRLRRWEGALRSWIRRAA